MDFKELIAKDVRLVILRCLAEDSGYSLNESILQDALGLYGHHLSRDRVKTELRWLEDQGLVTIEDIAGILLGKLTGRGMDVALGNCRVDGVKSPRPKC